MANLEKEAQAFTKAKEFIRPTGRRKVKISPIRWMGKNLLKLRSPNVYGAAMNSVDKVDELIRPLASKQKIYLAEMKKFKKGLSSLNFAISAKRFLKEQELINRATGWLGDSFKSIAGENRTIDDAINASIGKTPRKEEHIAPREVDEEKYIEEQLGKISSYYNELCKEALLGGRYWRTRTQSGREFAKKFDLLYRKFEMVLGRNIEILKDLDDLRDAGDPGAYYRKMLKFIDAKKLLVDKDVEAAWMMFKDLKPENEQIEAGPKNEELKEKPKDEINITSPVSVPAPALTDPNPSAATMPAGQDIPSQEPITPPGSALSHEEFINKLTKKADAGCSKEKLAKIMIKYADEIEETDPEYAMKLTIIAEGMLHE